MGALDVAQIEEQIRTTALTKRIRPSGFFLDYDRLRSGYVTDTQFFRVLWKNLGIQLTGEQQQSLMNKYDLKKDGRLNYRSFCDSIEAPFNPNDLTLNPAEQHVSAPEFLGTTRSLRPLTGESEQVIEDLLRSLASYYKYRGINLRTCCEDFDRHHIGVIQESQFYRSFPRPPEVTEEHVDLLVKKYRDPDRPGLLNYLNLHHDLVAIAERMIIEDATSLTRPTDISSFLSAAPGADATLQQIFDKVRIAVYKNGIRTPEFFRDYDKLRSGIITENQFVCGISLAVGKEAQLSRPEIQKVVEYYKIQDGRVHYKEFCDMLETAFNIPDLDKKPTESVVRPPVGALGRTLMPLTEAQDQRISQIIAVLSDQVRKRRLMMYPYFKDYDRGKGYTRVVTPTQFGRILHFLSLKVGPEDLKLLCRKFADPATNDINYPAFVQAVDKDFVGYIIGESNSIGNTEPETPVQPKTIDTSAVSFDDLMALIRNHILVNSLRVCEYFQDFDSLRSGSITKSQFKRCLSNLGLSALGKHKLSDPQFEILCQYYVNPNQPDKILWTKFMDDIESVFTQPNLEKNPTYKVPPQEVFCTPKPGTMDWSNASKDHAALVDETMVRLKARVQQRRLLAKPTFDDFDRHNNGHVTRGQFRQCLTMLELNCAEDEMQALEAKYVNDVGFNYMSFLHDLEPQEPPKFKYTERLKELREVNEKKNLPSNPVLADLEEVLTGIKNKVVKERVSVLEFMRDYDKLRTGRISKENFRRALDLCKFELKESEIALIEDKYKAYGYPNFVEYLVFVDEIESVFTTKHLEKAPMVEPQQFRPPVEWQLNQLPPEAEAMYNCCMNRLAEKVRKNRIQLFPLFEDYDRVHNGTVSRSQFRRVLSELELDKLVATEQEWKCLYNVFDVKIGGKNDVNYNGFCDTIYELAQFALRKP